MSVIEDKVRLSNEFPAESFKREAPPTPPRAPNTNRALVPVAQPLHRMHEGRVVRSPGRMLVGSPLPVPTREDIRNDTAVFSGRGKRRWKFSSGLVVVVTCMVTAGIVVSVTHYISKNRKANAVATEGMGATKATRPQPVTPVTSVPRSPSSALESDAPAPAQQSSNISVRDVVGAPGVPLPLAISVVNVSPDEHSFLMLHNVPAGVVISAGFPMKGAWAVSLRDLDGLTLQTADNYTGSFGVDVLLIRGANQQAEHRQFTATISRTGSAQPPKPDAADATLAAKPATGTESGDAPAATAEPRYVAAITPPPALVAQSKPAPVRQITAAEEAPMLAKAQVLLQNFDVTGARLLFEFLARRGSPKGALELAHTFDPVFFENANIRGMQPDVDMARQWYVKATELGNEEAAVRLRALAAR